MGRLGCMRMRVEDSWRGMIIEIEGVDGFERRMGEAAGMILAGTGGGC